MIPVFKKLEIRDEENAALEISEHINKMQKEIYNCLLNLTSENVTELSSDVTKITSNNGSEISGDLIKLKGTSGEAATIGYDKASGLFMFSVTDKDGNEII